MPQGCTKGRTAGTGARKGRKGIAGLRDEPAESLSLDLQSRHGDSRLALPFGARAEARFCKLPVLQALDEWRVQHTSAYAKARDQARAAATALRKIVQGQADLKTHENELTGAELKALLVQYESDITSAAKVF